MYICILLLFYLNLTFNVCFIFLAASITKHIGPGGYSIGIILRGSDRKGAQKWHCMLPFPKLAFLKTFRVTCDSSLCLSFIYCAREKFKVG